MLLPQFCAPQPQVQLLKNMRTCPTARARSLLFKAGSDSGLKREVTLSNGDGAAASDLLLSSPGWATATQTCTAR
eukprot:1138647-Pelagomonas_calceolata.AAC.6